MEKYKNNYTLSFINIYQKSSLHHITIHNMTLVNNNQDRNHYRNTAKYHFLVMIKLAM